MKRTHRADVFCWSTFDEARDLDFHAWAYRHAGGFVLVDPLPPSAHDRAQLERVTHVVVTNSDHLRGARELAVEHNAIFIAPAAERAVFDLGVAAGLEIRWVGEGDTVVPGLEVLALEGSKTPGELALVLEGSTLFTGDLLRSHAGGSLVMLPDAKLSDVAAARASVRRLAALPGIDAVLVGDGWPVFRDGGARLAELAARL